MSDKNISSIQPEFITPGQEMYSINTNIPMIAEKIFSEPPAPSHSFGLQLETDVNDGSSEEQARTIFEILMTLTLKGMRVKYGEGTDPRRLSPEQIGTLQKYMRSFGWNFTITSTPIDDESESESHRSELSPSQIEWYRLRLPDPENKLKHDIIFSACDIPDKISMGLKNGPI